MAKLCKDLWLGQFCGLTMAQPHPDSCSLSPSRMCKGIRRVKGKTCALREFTRESKSFMHRQSKTKNSTTIFHGQAGAQLSPGKQGFLTYNGHNSDHLPLSPSSPSFICWAAIGWGISFQALGVVHPDCVASPLLVHSQATRWQGAMRHCKGFDSV